MKRCGYYFFLILSAISLPSYADPSDNRSRDDTRIYHLYADVDLISTLKFSYGRPRITVKSVFPQLQSPTEYDGVASFNRLVTKMVEDEIDSFKIQVNRYSDKTPTKTKLNNLFIDYATSVIKSNKNHITSVRFSIQGHMIGSKKPYHYHRVLNYDLENEKRIELQDLFLPDANYLEVISEYVQKNLLKRLKNKRLIMQGTQPDAENFRNWNIKPNGLLFTFDEYQVAPKINGAQTVLVPFKVLENILDHDSAIYGCIKNKKRCVRENLLTGGFIDEAINTRHRRLNPIFS